MNDIVATWGLWPMWAGEVDPDQPSDPQAEDDADEDDDGDEAEAEDEE